jgi:hypothetical protein
MADTWMSELSAVTGLPHFPKQGPFQLKDGAVIGNKRGYLVAVGPAKIERKAAISVLVRFPETQQITMVRTGLEQALAETPETTKPAGKAKTCLKTGPDFVRWDWTYSFGKPKAQQVAALTAAMVEATRKCATAFDGKCEGCHSASTPEVLLLEGSPVYYCAGCQEKMAERLREAGAAYEAKPTNVPMGILFGAAASAAGGIAWGLVAYFLKRIFLWGAIGIGFLVSTAFFKGYGKINNLGRCLVGVFTVASVLLGDTLFYTLIAAQELKIDPSVALFLRMGTQLWDLETSGKNVLSPIFGLIGAALVVYQLRKPKFAVKFERLGQPAA